METAFELTLNTLKPKSSKALPLPPASNKWSLLLAAFTVAASVFVSSCSTPMKREFHESGRASWYGRAFHGRKTANGEVFNMHDYTAAHPTLPFGTRVQVRSMRTGKSVVVRINDRGPYSGKRVIDLSYAAARKLGMVSEGEDQVVINQVASQ